MTTKILSAALFVSLMAAGSLVGCSGSAGKGVVTESASTKFDVYYVQGEKLYKENCANCHHADGAGLGLVYPPLNKSDYMENNLESAVCLIKNGKHGEIVVNGDSFIQGMPGIPTLTDLEVAEITTYVYNTWSHKRGMVDVQETTRILTNCSAEPAK